MVANIPPAEGREKLTPALSGIVVRTSPDPSIPADSPEPPVGNGTGGFGVPFSSGSPFKILALGSQLKNTVCLASGGEAWIVASHGDLSVNYSRFLETISKTVHETGTQSLVLAHDLYPGYLSTEYARGQTLPTVGIQHQHAHAISCMLDAGLAPPVIGVICDGMGYGVDGALWGGEVMLCDLDSFRRLVHLDYFALPGGSAAATETWRPAMSVLRAAFPNTWNLLDIPSLRSVPARERRHVTRQFELGLDVAVTSSLGRLFDAVAALTGICLHNSFDGEAAQGLEAAARAGEAGRLPVKAYPFDFCPGPDGCARIDWRPAIRAIVDHVRGSVEAPRIAARFHATIVAMFTAAVEYAANVTRVRRVVLSGGCFHNEILRSELGRELQARGYWTAEHRRLSCGDAGLSVGQAAIAAAVVAKKAR